jgi:hypothetical protein
MEFAYAMGHSRTLGRDPRLQPVIERVDELRREIAALKQQMSKPGAAGTGRRSDDCV